MRTFDDFTLPGFWQDPISAFQPSFDRNLRIQSSPDGGLAVLGYHALRAIGMHPAIDGTPMQPAGENGPRWINEVLRHGVFTQVGAEHRRSRRAVLAGLNNEAARSFGPQAREVATRRMAALGSGPFDLFVELCLPFAAESWARFLGHDPEEAPLLAEEVETFSRQTYSPDHAMVEEADCAAASLLSRTGRVLESGGDGPATRMAQALGAPNGSALVTSLLFDAIDTTAAGLAGTLAILLHEGIGREALRDEAFREQAIEEALRLATPAVFTVRQAREEAEVAGTVVLQGAMVWMWWSAGNCDPEAFPQPARFQPGRPNRGLPFGIGAHGCLGHGWSKQMAHVLTEIALAGERRLRMLSPELRWGIGGARRPQGQTVLFQ